MLTTGAEGSASFLRQDFDRLNLPAHGNASATSPRTSPPSHKDDMREPYQCPDHGSHSKREDPQERESISQQ